MGILIGPPIGGLLPPIIASYVAITCVLGSLLYVVVVLEESLSERSRLEVRQANKWFSHHHLCLPPPLPPFPDAYGDGVLGFRAVRSHAVPHRGA